ncbi:MAG: radical SAM family heme chaperone HemW [Spirochaetota bacterium]
MSGIYLHIPFCKKKCKYCDFYSIDKYNNILVEDFTEAIIKELSNRKEELQASNPETIFIGGGTPNLLPLPLLNKILSKIEQSLNLSLIKEYTIESNPEYINKDKLNLFYDKGINRISIGVQSFNDNHLSLIGRITNAKTNYKAIELIKESSIKELNCDMIFGMPEQNLKDLDYDLNQIIEKNPQHISYYGLTVEEYTPLNKMVEKGLISIPDDENTGNMYLKIINTLKVNDYNMYEISNFSKKGFHSKHNLNYWNRGLYYGLGPSAVTFNGDTRYANRDSVIEYINSINTNKSPIKYSEKLSPEQELIETIMLSLRKVEGLYLTAFKDKFQFDLQNYIKSYFPAFLDDKLVISNNRLYLSREGFLLYDYIIDMIISKL